MCTVSWSRQAHGGLTLCFNRDEHHRRADGLPPQVWPHGFLAPVDATAGGTWLAVRRDGMVLALLNHYPSGYVPNRNTQSRGILIPALAERSGRLEIAALREIVAKRMNPFRLLALSPSGTSRVFTWNGETISQRRCDANHPGMLTSSSWNTASVVAARHAAFRAWLGNHQSPGLPDHLAFHKQSTHPRGGAWAVCMSRDDARSVSLNTITIIGTRATMTHQLRPEGAAGFERENHHADLLLSTPS